MQHLSGTASLGIGAVVDFLTTGRRPESTPSLDFHDTEVIAVTETPVPGLAVHRPGLGVLRMPGTATDISDTEPLQGAFQLGIVGLGAAGRAGRSGEQTRLPPNP